MWSLWLEGEAIRAPAVPIQIPSSLGLPERLHPMGTDTPHQHSPNPLSRSFPITWGIGFDYNWSDF